ncbi:hypothetical protein O181_073388 [Austropuccinia psidii MF-1]|uniref:Uncharacterized protein n=1 Tax=Austropuccinia psidii MF-1 TaxID=1389203 RepID=A0A9Q3F4W6_9BASI|nr:hypothetical protein [Austropuccinia psidii MF-1]
MDLSQGSIEEKIKRNRKREDMMFKLNIYGLEVKDSSEKTLTGHIPTENHHVAIDNSFSNLSTTYIRLGYETIPNMEILDETSLLNIIPIRLATEMGIGLKNTQMHIWKNHILRNKTAGKVW